MAYSASSKTEAELKALEKQISKVYTSSYKEMSEECKKYFEGYDEIKNGKKIHHPGLSERFAREYEAAQKGAYTPEELQQWLQTQIARGKGWEKLRDDMADRMVNANQVASAYINDATPSIYSINYNYAGYEVSQAYGSTNFQIYDEQTIKNLIKGENHTEFRTVSVDPVRDYEWNQEQIQNELTSGILQGKTIPEISDSFLGVMKRNRSAAIRNARTAVTSAQNAGRIKGYEWAEEQGWEVQKEWISTLDGRTRDSHAALDGETVPQSKKFSNGLQYPGDPNGRPAEVYNCRCTMKAVFPGINDKHKRQTYKEWEKETLANWDNLDERQLRKAGNLKERAEAKKAKGQEP